MNTSSQARIIPTLDGWRAIAISLVMVHHAGTALYGEKEYWSHGATRFGTIGVPIFFGLSGFLICKLLLDELAENKRISLSGFYVRRAFRILPPFLLFVSIIALLGCMKSPLELISSVFFFRNYVPDAATGVYTAHLWSLSVEEHFYLIWPCLLILLSKTRRPLLATAAFAIGIGLWRSLDLHLHLLAQFAPALDTSMRTDLRLDGLIWGCCAAFVLNNERARSVLQGRAGIVLLIASAGLFLIQFFVPIPLAGTWFSLSIPCMMLGTVTHPANFIGRLLSLKPLAWVGRISYSLYLWQQLFLVPSWERHAIPAVQSLPWNIAITFACAALSYYFVEKRFIRIGRRLSAQLVQPEPIAVESRFFQKTTRIETAASVAARES